MPILKNNEEDQEEVGDKEDKIFLLLKGLAAELEATGRVQDADLIRGIYIKELFRIEQLKNAELFKRFPSPPEFDSFVKVIEASGVRGREVDVVIEKVKEIENEKEDEEEE